MSRFFKIFIYGILSFIFSFALFGAEKSSEEISPEHIKLLIRKLSADDFADREKATKELIRLGYYARDEVKKSLDTTDPEARMRLKGIWEKIQWVLFPGAGEDVNSFLAQTKPLTQDWNPLTKKYGPEIILLFLELKGIPEYSTLSKKGLLSLIENTKAEELADFIKRSPKKKTLIDLLVSLEMLNFQQKEAKNLSSLFIALGLKNRAIMTAAASWKMDSKAEIPDEILLYFRDSDFTKNLFSEFREELDGTETLEKKDWKIGFFAKVAKDIERKELIQNLLKDIDYNITNELAIVYIAEILISMEFYKEALQVLEGNHAPRTIYLRSIAFSKSGDKESADRLMELLDSKLVEESDCYYVAEVMSEFKDTRAIKLWKKILDIEPHDSSFDSNARFRLGTYYESQGNYGKAADLLEEGLEKMQGVLIFNGEGGESQSGNQAVESMRNRIYNLREQEKGGSEEWLNAMKALREDKRAASREWFNKFTKNNPDYPWAYYYLAIIEEKNGDPGDALKLIERGFKCVPENNSFIQTQFIVKKSLLLGKNNEYGKAVEALKKAVELEPENANILSIYAMQTFYSKDFKKSAELFEKTYKMDPEDLYAPLWRYISLKKIGKDPTKEFANFADKKSGNKWPMPLISYYNGAIDAEKCIEKAVTVDKERENEKLCEAFYFIGEFLFLKGDKEEAEKYFKKCIKCNIPDFREHTASMQRLEELKR